jgi:hypothetical protein
MNCCNESLDGHTTALSAGCASLICADALQRYIRTTRFCCIEYDEKFTVPSKGSGQLLFPLRDLEDKFCGKLENACVVRRGRRQESVSRAGGWAIAVRGCIDLAPLCVIENVECFCAKLEVRVLVHREVLE